MKQELIEKINPVISEFVDKVLATFDDFERIRKDLSQKEALYQDLIAQKEKELSDIRVQKAVDKESYDKKITEMECSKNEHNQKAKNYQDLQDELERKRKGIEDDLAKTKIELARSIDIRNQAENIKQDAEKIKRDYELKLDSLRVDFDKNFKDKKDIEAEKTKLTARENQIFMDETRQQTTAKELSDKEISIRVERKEIDRLVKRYNLENSLKEK